MNQQIELLEYDHVAIPESKQKNYNIERLREESDHYIDDIAPTLGSKQQRAENLKSIAWFKTEKTRVLSDCLQQGNCRIATEGKDSRAIEREYELAKTAINDFKSGKFPLVDEKNKKIYYYNQEQIRDMESRDREYSYEVIPESKKDNFYIERPQEKN